MNRNDLRYIKTDKAIIDSLKSNVEKYGFANVHVSDICNEAQISRNTFYAHYTDKYAILDKLYDDLKTNIMNNLHPDITLDLTNMIIRSSVHWCLSEMLNYKEDIVFLLKCSDEQFANILGEMIVDNPFEYMLVSTDHIHDDIYCELNRRYMLDAMMGFIKLWLKNTDIVSLDEAVNLMTELCTTPVKLYMERLLKQPNIELKI